MAVALVAAAVFHVLVGSAVGMTAGNAVEALLGFDTADPTHRNVMWLARMPRMVLAVVVGVSLALAGTVMQAVFRNPLASPEVLGTSAGAAFGGVLAIAFGWHLVSVHAVSLLSLAGALGVTVLVFFFAGRGARFSVAGLLLAGIAINTLMGSLIPFVMSFTFGDPNQSADALFWLMGGLDSKRWSNVVSAALGLLVFGVALVPFARDMNLLTLRDDAATSLGVRSARLRIGLVVLACGLTGFSVANAGGIAFVGLVVPHLARFLVGPGHARLLPAAALLGATVLVLADAVCRLVVDINLRVGVVTSLLGAPFFLVILVRHQRGRRL